MAVRNFLGDKSDKHAHILKASSLIALTCKYYSKKPSSSYLL